MLGGIDPSSTSSLSVTGSLPKLSASVSGGRGGGGDSGGGLGGGAGGGGILVDEEWGWPTGFDPPDDFLSDPNKVSTMRCDVVWYVFGYDVMWYGMCLDMM